MKPSLFCVHILTPPFRYPLRYDLLPQELFNLQAPQHRPHPHNSRPIPFSGPQLIRPTSRTLFWETLVGCPISRSGDIVLYLIYNAKQRKKIPVYGSIANLTASIKTKLKNSSATYMKALVWIKENKEGKVQDDLKLMDKVN